MAVLNIRNLPDAVHRELRVRAAKHGRSMEAEARAILAEACRPSRSIAEIVGELQLRIRQASGGKEPVSMVEELLRDRREEVAREEAEYQEWVRRRG